MIFVTECKLGNKHFSERLEADSWEDAEIKCTFPFVVTGELISEIDEKTGIEIFY